jgi:hypothetical protein
MFVERCHVLAAGILVDMTFGTSGCIRTFPKSKDVLNPIATTSYSKVN